MARSVRTLPRRPDDRARLEHRERCPAVHPDRPRLLPGRARLGGQRLPADLRRLPAAVRSPRRPARQQAGLPGRGRVVHGRLGRVRVGSIRRAARHRSCRPGPRRRRGLGGCAGPDHGPVHRPRRAGEGDGRLRLRDVGRRRRRRPPRWRPDRAVLVELDLPGERAHRRRRLGRSPPRPTRRRGRAREVPPRRRSARSW